MSNPEQILVELGFVESEAKAYIALLKYGPLSGYELAKVSGIPRGNIYKVLEKLERRGAAVKVGSDGSTRYAPVAPDELLPRLAEGVLRKADQARALLQGVGAPTGADQVWNVQGYQPLVDHARSLIGAARDSLVVAICREEAPVLAAEMRAARERGVAISTLCLTGCAEACGACQGEINRYQVAPSEGSRWLILVLDGEEALAGEIGPSAKGGASAFRTRQPMLTNLAEGYVRRSVGLAQMTEKLGTGELAQFARRALGAPGQPLH